MKKLVSLLILFVFTGCLSGCWAPRCPVESCHVKFEHFHTGQTSGVFSGKGLVFPRMHFPWDKNKGEANPNTDLQTEGKRQKIRKKFPWERW